MAEEDHLAHLDVHWEGCKHTTHKGEIAVVQGDGVTSVDRKGTNLGRETGRGRERGRKGEEEREGKGEGEGKREGEGKEGGGGGRVEGRGRGEGRGRRREGRKGERGCREVCMQFTHTHIQ